MRAVWSELGTGVAAEPRSARLGDLKAGTSCTVVRLDSGTPDRLRRLLALGVLPGSRLEVTQAWPGIVFRMGFSEFALDRELARSIIVVRE